MDASTRDLVRWRAGERCEYCRLQQEHSGLIHHIEHIVARQHGGSDDPYNLALACHRSNLHKGPNLTGIAPRTQQVVPLFQARQYAKQTPAAHQNQCHSPARTGFLTFTATGYRCFLRHLTDAKPRKPLTVTRASTKSTRPHIPTPSITYLLPTTRPAHSLTPPQTTPVLPLNRETGDTQHYLQPEEATRIGFAIFAALSKQATYWLRSSKNGPKAKKQIAAGRRKGSSSGSRYCPRVASSHDTEMI
jgi:hypothetical protein